MTIELEWGPTSVCPALPTLGCTKGGQEVIATGAETIIVVLGVPCDRVEDACQVIDTCH